MEMTMTRSPSLSALLLAGLALSTAACSRPADDAAPAAKGGATQDWSTLKDFNAIEATGPDDVAVTIGDAYSVRAEGDPKAIERLTIAVKGDRLVIGRKSDGNWAFGRKNDDGDVTVHVTMPAIRAAALTGAGDFTLDRAEGDMLDLSLTGAGDFAIGTVKLRSLKTDITGAGSVKIAGTADSGELAITGAGDIDADDLKLGTAKVSILGAGNIAFASDGAVAIRIMGPGDVTVKGKAQCTTSGTGPGEARCAP
ncbi:head GIN domain-containing protein [Sphingobium xenophagum]|uniref:Putative auto-transporter adhesin head GIN domain-containing protein n=1 Tax=Sphingobium xenophagum TaxID=121428 RepID=A0A401J198_SPHXE|nr:hypothetical protein MBESOW_P1654 [Sphingobium xenophagum]